MRILLRKVLLLLFILFLFQSVSIIYGAVNQPQEVSYFQKKIAWIKSFFKKNQTLSDQELIKGFEQAAEDPFFYMRPAKPSMVVSQSVVQSSTVVPNNSTLEQKQSRAWIICKKLVIGCLCVVVLSAYMQYVHQAAESYVKFKTEEIQQVATGALQAMKKDCDQRLDISDKKLKEFEDVYVKLQTQRDHEFNELSKNTAAVMQQSEAFEETIESDKEEIEKVIGGLDEYFEQLKEVNDGHEEKIIQFIDQIKQIQALALQRNSVIESQKVTIGTLEAKLVAMNKQLAEMQTVVATLKK